MAISFSKLVDFKLKLFKSAFNFGHEVTNMASDHFNISRGDAKLPTAVADIAIGAYCGYAGVASFIGGAAGFVAAAGLIATAPVSAVGGVIVGGIMMGLSALTAAAGAGLLASAAEKTGVVKSHVIESTSGAIIAKAVAPVQSVFASPRALSSTFRNVVSAKKEAVTAVAHKLNLNNIHIPRR